MSRNIPFEIEAEIIKSLPVKSLIRFRCVSKTWKSLIDSSDFISHYSGQQHRLLVRYRDPFDSKRKYVSLVDDDTFPRDKVSVTVPHSVKMLLESTTVGSSHGLICLYNSVPDSRTGSAAIWNPSIRKVVDVHVPNVAVPFWMPHGTVLGFGVCPETADPKIVKITHTISWRNMESMSCIPYQVEVFTLSTGVWRSPYSNLPRKSIIYQCMKSSVVSVDGILYLLAFDRMTVDGEYKTYRLIISFDMTSEEFKEVNLPHQLRDNLAYKMSIFNMKENLAVLSYGRSEANEPVFSVWRMEDGVRKSFVKLFTINNGADTFNYNVRGFRKTGEPLIEVHQKLDGRSSPRSLAAYESYSKSINDLGVNRSISSYHVNSYTETLLLL